MARRTQLLSCAVLLLAGLALCHASEDPTESLPGVVDLTPDNFDSIVNGGKAVLIEFYAPWCGHCKRLVPEYTKLGELVQADPKLKNRVVIAKVNADSHRSLGDKFEVRGFPTIKYLPRGKAPSKDSAVDYNKGRTAENFIDFIKEKLAADAGFARVEVLDAHAKKFVEAEDKAAVVAVVKEQLAELSGDDKAHGELYVKLMEKAVEKGADYLSKEKARLDKMLAGGSVAAVKMDELSKKASVLGAFFADEE